MHVNARVAPLSSRLVLALVEDRTRERRVEAIRRDFVANVSHELKTPVGALNLLAEAVEDAADDPEAVTSVRGEDADRERRLTRLVQQIIELSRLQGDDPLDDPQPVDVDAIVARAIDQSKIDADSRDIEVVQDGARGTQVLGNADEVALALSNLVSNAVALPPTTAGSVSASPARHHRRPLRHRPGHRHPGRRDRPDLRAVLPRRPGPPPLHRRHRPGP